MEREPEDEVPELPRNLTEISDETLMDNLRVQIEWQNFFSAEVVKLELAEGRAEQYLKQMEATIYLLNVQGTVTETKMVRETDPVVMDAHTKWFEAKVARKAMQVTAENRERCAQLLSREITRRTNREPVQRRADWNA